MSTNKTNNRYSPELKLEAVTRVLAGESVKTVAKDYDVKDPDYIYIWIEKYETYGEAGLNRKIRTYRKIDKDQQIKELKMENELLKKYLQLQRREAKG
ncbi:transposase [Alkalihalobacterium alkalinitrilicum]|uniref:transposase n=1 Tax=Alkalihalobacterium alkalinitrilicum TaxID=427920 RepID=UPI000995CF4F|nr:transposase [Alkalihalobacterium alkalinitrilicum]